MNDVFLSKSQYNTLWRTSWFSLISGIFAIYRCHYSLAPAPIIVWITSINYWCYPTYSWRYYLDIYSVRSALLYNIIRAYNMEYAREYYILMIIAITFYAAGKDFYRENNLWMYTLCHSQLHLFGNMACIILYRSKL